MNINKRMSIEAIAEAWASIDGKLETFNLCKTDKELEEIWGYYEGYITDSEELLTRVEKRGFTLVRKDNTNAKED